MARGSLPAHPPPVLPEDFLAFDMLYRYVTALGAVVRSGTGSPEGVVVAPVGTLYLREDGGTGTTLYVKETGTGNTGWVAK